MHPKFSEASHVLGPTRCPSFGQLLLALPRYYTAKGRESRSVQKPHTNAVQRVRVRGPQRDELGAISRIVTVLRQAYLNVVMRVIPFCALPLSYKEPRVALPWAALICHIPASPLPLSRGYDLAFALLREKLCISRCRKPQAAVRWHQ